MLPAKLYYFFNLEQRLCRKLALEKTFAVIETLRPPSLFLKSLLLKMYNPYTYIAWRRNQERTCKTLCQSVKALRRNREIQSCRQTYTQTKFRTLDQKLRLRFARTKCVGSGAPVRRGRLVQGPNFGFLGSDIYRSETSLVWPTLTTLIRFN